MNKDQFEIDYLIACVASGTVVPHGPDYEPKEIVEALGIADLPWRSELGDPHKREEIANLFCPEKRFRDVIGPTSLFYPYNTTELPISYHEGGMKIYHVKEMGEFNISREALGQSLANILLGEKVYNFHFDPNKEVMAIEKIKGDFFYNANIENLSEVAVKNYAKAIELATALDLGIHHDKEDGWGLNYTYNTLVSESGEVTNLILGALFLGYKGFVKEEEMMSHYGEIIQEERARVRGVMKCNYLENLDLINSVSNYVKSLEFPEDEPKLPMDIVEMLGDNFGF
ncbi:hypothetical protein HN385_05670 [archaeon]|jgi:hypothetical protein|nr:hypothetical protein [archaeon]MBT3451466.1 hypothetical protein [archaeon]MBT6868540.1 hypothetical protein [archaeon]MBT7193074.1 hypothetical protein [archaeon]MBT7381163.1 hypothetical protein [archaeon]